MLATVLYSGLVVTLTLATTVKSQETTTSAPMEPRTTEVIINESTTLEICGFGDLLATFQEQSDGKTFDVVQAEVDIESGLTARVAIALAIAYDEGIFTIGAFTVDYALWSVSENSPSTLGISKVTFGGGQYDVPFGIDFHVYPSIDRKLVSCPLVVENTHDCWNDYGGYLSVDATWGNAVAFVANGFSHESTTPAGEDLETHNDLAVGGRLGLTPHESLEIGGSVASIKGLDQSHDMSLASTDLQFSTAGLEIKGEYIAHQFESHDGSHFTNDGYYVQGIYNVADWYFVGRYGEFRPDQQSADITRLSVGIGRNINDIIELRVEYQANKTVDNAAIFQVAFMF